MDQREKKKRKNKNELFSIVIKSFVLFPFFGVVSSDDVLLGICYYPFCVILGRRFKI